MMEGVYYVYRVDVDSECYYIGMGKGERINHCLSGTSNNYKLNEVYFKNKFSNQKVKTSCYKVKEHLSKEEALKIETDLIIKYRPYANTAMKNIIKEEVVFEGKKLSDVLEKDSLRLFLNERVKLLNSTSLNRVEHSITDYNIKDNLNIVNKSFESSIVRTKTTSKNLCVSCCKEDVEVLKGKGFRKNYNIHNINHYEDYFTGSPITLAMIPYYITRKHKIANLTYLPKEYNKDEVNIYLFVELILKLINTGSENVSVLVADNKLKKLIEGYLQK